MSAAGLLDVNPLSEAADILLADVAIRIQLSQTNYTKLVDRYETINRWIERPGSPLESRVTLFYPHGSMAIGATIASRLRTDEFDADTIAQLGLPREVPPRLALDLLYLSIRGEPGSRYYDMTRRQTRCVTVDYDDDMHIDVTPAVRLFERPERMSFVFHSKPDAPGAPEYHVPANPYGFAEWFKSNTPLDRDFANIFERRAADYELRILAEKADSEDLPPRVPPFRKSKAVIVLQLLKRWRNVRYDNRQGRRPPSPVIAKLIADAANHTHRLSEELLLQASHMLEQFRFWHQAGLRIHIVNPVPGCGDDVFTDRWPASLHDQVVFISDLEDLVRKVEQLVAGCDLAQMREIMTDLFGEAPTSDVFKAFNQREVGGPISAGRSYHSPGAGRLGLATAGAAAPGILAVARPTRAHTFFGGDDVQ